MESIQKNLSGLLTKVRTNKPLVHHITNYVTVNDCANITLAIGASPIMADAIEEAADIAAISSALVLNIGTLNHRTVKSMIQAGKKANEKNIPVILDPVGAGASLFRNEAAERMIRELRVDVLRGNISEIRYMAGLAASTKGVDAGDSETNAGTIARETAKKLSCVVAITGAVDAISDGSRLIRIHNGHAALSQITGTGCMCSSLIGSFCGANPDQLLLAVSAGILAMGLAGEIAYEKTKGQGNGSFHMAIIDAISLLDDRTIEIRGKCNED